MKWTSTTLLILAAFQSYATAFTIELSKNGDAIQTFDKLDTTHHDKDIVDWYGFNSGKAYSAKTPQEYEDANGEWVGIVAVQPNEGTDISLVVIYDMYNDKTGGKATAKFECEGCGGDLSAKDLFPVLDDTQERPTNKKDWFDHKWSPCCTDGFASKPLAPGSTICLTFSKTSGVQNGIRYHTPDGPINLYKGNPNGVKICMDLTAPEIVKEMEAKAAEVAAAADEEEQQEAPKKSTLHCQDKVVEVDATCSVPQTPATDLLTAESSFAGQEVKTNLGNLDKIGEYPVKVSASDGSECAAKLTVLDRTPPSIVLRGQPDITLGVNGYFDEPGYDTSDNCDKVVTVVVSGDTVDTKTAGAYTIKYTAQDASGNTAPPISRTVRVRRDCVYGTWNEESEICDCIGGPAPSAGNGFCHDDKGACTIPRKWNQDMRQFYCGDTPNVANGCETDDDCVKEDFGAAGGVCVDKDNDGEKECIPQPHCVHGSWSKAKSQCDCIGAPGGNGYCRDESGACTIARSFDMVAWKYYCPESRRLRRAAM